MTTPYAFITFFLIYIGASFSLHGAERVVALGGAATETLIALGLESSLIAVDASSELPERLAALPRLGYYRALSTEGLLSLRPDLLLGTEDMGPPHVISQLRAAGVNVQSVTAEKSLRGAITRTEQIGEITGRQEKARELATPLRERLEQPLAPLSNAPRVVFFYSRGGGAATAGGRNTGADEMIRLAGGVNAVQGFEGYRALTPEALVTARPDVVLIPTNGLTALGGEEALWSLPGLASTPAGRQRRLIVMDDLLLLGFGPRTAEALDILHNEFRTLP